MSASVSLTNALGPGTQLRNLKYAGANYELVLPSLNALLVYPFLDIITLDPLSDAKLSSDNLRNLILDGSTRFVKICRTDAELSRKVVSWSLILNAFIGVLDVASFVQLMEPIAQLNAKEGRSQAGDNLLFFTSFRIYIEILGTGIEDMTDRMKKLDAEIEARSQAIAEANILETLFEIFKKIFDLAATAKESEGQIAALLGLQVSSLEGSFGSLFTDRPRLELVLASLKKFQFQIANFRRKLAILHESLTNVVETSTSLISVWDDVSKRLESVAGVKESPTPSQVATIKSTWMRVAEDAATFRAIIAGLTTSASQSKGAIKPLDKTHLRSESKEARLARGLPPPPPETFRLARRLLHLSAAEQALLTYIKGKDLSMDGLNLLPWIKGGAWGQPQVDDVYTMAVEFMNQVKGTPAEIPWDSIVSALSVCKTAYGLFSGTNGATYLDAGRSLAIEQWQTIEQSAWQYLFALWTGEYGLLVSH